MDSNSPITTANPADGRPESDAVNSARFDPRLPFGSARDRKARWIWLVASAAAVLTFVPLSLALLQFGQDGRYYLLSSVSQVLAAIVALAATLPVVFAGLSDYLPSFGERLVAGWHYRGFVIMFCVTILTALLILCFKCAPSLVVVTCLAAAAGCLGSLVPYIVWVADRTRPKNHFDDLVSRADALVRRYEGERDPTKRLEPAGEVQEYLGLLVQTASVAAQRGATRYLGHALVNVLLFWLKYDARNVAWAARRGAEAWRNFTVSRADDFLAVERAWDCLSQILTKECWLGTLRPSADVYEEAAVAMGTPPSERVRPIVIRGLWRLGIVAQHTDANGNAPRAVAKKVADIHTEFAPEGLPKIMPMFEEHVRTWFQTLYEIDPTAELAEFRALVIDEHTALRRRLDEASR